jgi:hypothetical protein
MVGLRIYPKRDRMQFAFDLTGNAVERASDEYATFSE